MEIASLYLTETIKSFRGLKSNTEKAFGQISEAEFHQQPEPSSNSVAIIIKHLAGNMRSRFTNFLTTDGEKPDRKRDLEFIDGFKTHSEILAAWENGWKCMFNALSELNENNLTAMVYIREEPHTVLRALQRQLVHYAYHCGQIVFLCKQIRAGHFESLSIPVGKSEEYKVKAPRETPEK